MVPYRKSDSLPVVGDFFLASVVIEVMVVGWGGRLYILLFVV